MFLFYSKNSFKNIEKWVKELKNYANPDIKIFLIGNKADLENERKVTTAEAEKLKNDYEFDLFMETSGKTGFNAKKIFVEAAKIILKEFEEHHKNLEKKMELTSINLQNHKSFPSHLHTESLIFLLNFHYPQQHHLVLINFLLF